WTRPRPDLNHAEGSYHDARERGARIQGWRHVLPHLPGDEQLGDQRRKAEEQRRSQQVNRVPTEPPSERPHNVGITMLMSNPSIRTSTYETIAMSAVNLARNVRNRRKPFRRSMIWPMVMKARIAPTLKVVAN